VVEALSTTQQNHRTTLKLRFIYSHHSYFELDVQRHSCDTALVISCDVAADEVKNPEVPS
jgi:hypothetical protein